MRLIDANELTRLIQSGDDLIFDAATERELIYMIDHQPTIEAEPVRHGRWKNIPGMDNTVFCSECLAAANKELAMKYKGCPFCLARMDGGKGGNQE